MESYKFYVFVVCYNTGNRLVKKYENTWLKIEELEENIKQLFFYNQVLLFQALYSNPPQGLPRGFPNVLFSSIIVLEFLHHLIQMNLSLKISLLLILQYHQQLLHW